jgi:hypothetical protein
MMPTRKRNEEEMSEKQIAHLVQEYVNWRPSGRQFFIFRAFYFSTFSLLDTSG